MRLVLTPVTTENVPDFCGGAERGRPAEAQGGEVLQKRTRSDAAAAEAEPCDDNQFGKSPKQPKVKKALIVSGGLCGFKARRAALAARQACSDSASILTLRFDQHVVR